MRKQSTQNGINALMHSRRAVVRADATVMELEAEMMAMDLREEMMKRVLETDEGKLIHGVFEDFEVTWYQTGRVGFTIVTNTVNGSIQVTDRGRVVLDRMAEALDRMLVKLDGAARYRAGGGNREGVAAAIKLRAPA